MTVFLGGYMIPTTRTHAFRGRDEVSSTHSHAFSGTGLASSMVLGVFGSLWIDNLYPLFVTSPSCILFVCRCSGFVSDGGVPLTCLQWYGVAEKGCVYHALCILVGGNAALSGTIW